MVLADANMSEQQQLDRPSALAGKRERKSIERLEVELPTPSELVIVPGNGCKLGSIANVAFRIAKLPPKSETLKRLHLLAYGRPGIGHLQKKNLREFSGFDIDAKCEKMKAAASRCTIAQLREVLTVCDLDGSASKDTMVERLASFMQAPAESGKPSLLEKDAEKPSGAEKRKRVVEKAGARAEREKKAMRKAPPAAAKPAAPPSGFERFQAARMGRMLENNPALTHADLVAYLRGKWEALEPESKAKFEEEAAKLKAEHAHLRKCQQTARAVLKANKGGAAHSRKAQLKGLVAAQLEDLDDCDDDDALGSEEQQEPSPHGAQEGSGADAGKPIEDEVEDLSDVE